MEKKVYCPTMDELYIMQDLGANIYQYLLIKAVESLIIEGIKYPSKGILKNAYKYLRENPDIAHAICRIFPNEIEYSECVKYDVRLCMELIQENKQDNIKTLDNLSYFVPSVQGNALVINNVIDILNEELLKNPKYRFKYKSSELLDNIFGLNVESYIINPTNYKKISAIEPAYAIKIGSKFDRGTKETLLKEGFLKYIQRYDVEPFVGYEYRGKDILTNPDTNVKRLIKCIKQNKENLY